MRYPFPVIVITMRGRSKHPVQNEGNTSAFGVDFGASRPTLMLFFRSCLVLLSSCLLSVVLLIIILSQGGRLLTDGGGRECVMCLAFFLLLSL